MSEEITALLPPGTWVQQGPATLVVREAGWAVMVPGLKKNVIEAAWVVLGKAPKAEEFIDQLVAESELESADKLTAILFGLVDGTTVTYGVKGKTPISVYTAEGAQQIAGTDDEPFVIKKVEGVRRTAFGELPPEDAVGLPRVSVGITRARGFVHVTVDPAELDEEARKALTEQVEADGRSIEDPEAKQRKKDKPPPPTRPKPGTSSPRKPMLATRKPGEMPPSLQNRSRGASSSSAVPRNRPSRRAPASSTTSSATSPPPRPLQRLPPRRPRQPRLPHPPRSPLRRPLRSPLRHRLRSLRPNQHQRLRPNQHQRLRPKPTRRQRNLSQKQSPSQLLRLPQDRLPSPRQLRNRSRSPSLSLRPLRSRLGNRLLRLPRPPPHPPTRPPLRTQPLL